MNKKHPKSKLATQKCVPTLSPLFESDDLAGTHIQDKDRHTTNHTAIASTERSIADNLPNTGTRRVVSGGPREEGVGPSPPPDSEYCVLGGVRRRLDRSCEIVVHS